MNFFCNQSRGKPRIKYCNPHILKSCGTLVEPYINTPLDSLALFGSMCTNRQCKWIHCLHVCAHMWCVGGT